MNSRDRILAHLGEIVYHLAERKRHQQAKRAHPEAYKRGQIPPDRDLDRAFVTAVADRNYSALEAAVNQREKGARKSRCPAPADVTTLAAYGLHMEAKRCITESNRYYRLAERLNPGAYQKLREVMTSSGTRDLL